MKILVAGVYRIEGKSSKTGNNYDMPRLHTLTPIVPVTRENMKLTGFGFEPGSMDMTAEAVAKSAGLKFPGVYNLVTDITFRQGEAHPIVTDLQPA